MPAERAGIAIIPCDAIPSPRGYKELGHAIAATRLRVPIAATYTLAEAAQAHERIAAGHVLGKVVLRIR